MITSAICLEWDSDSDGDYAEESIHLGICG
jgi:hypothetical protein